MAVEQLEPVAQPPTEGGLQRRRIGVPDIVFFVVAASAPLTVAAGGIPQTFAVTGVVGLPLVFVVLALTLVVFSAGYAAMSRRISGAGAFYAYIAQGLGRVTGVGAASVALISYNCMQIGIYGLFGFTTADFIKSKTGVDLPWWAVVLAAIAVVGTLGYRRIDLNARVLAVLLICESLTVLVFDVSQFSTAPHGIPLHPFSIGAMTAGATGAAFCFTMASFMGFESAALYAEECENPRRTIGRATYIAVGVIGVFYALTAWAMVVGAGQGKILGDAEHNGPNLVFVLGARSLGSGFADIAQLFLITSLFAALLSFHNAVARYFFALGREGVLPARLGAAHPRHGSPATGSLTQSLLAAAVIAVFALLRLDPMNDLFNWFTNLGALGVILLLTITSVAVAAFFRRHPARGEAAWSRLIAPVIAAVALLAVFVTALLNFNVLLGTDSGSVLSWLLPGLIFVAGAIGLAHGLRLKRNRPEVFAGIGGEVSEAD